MTDPQLQSELDAIERAVHRARGFDTDAPEAHPMDFNLPGPRDFRAMRETCGLSTDEVGDRIDMSPHTIYQIESGNSRPSMTTLQKLLRLYRAEWPRGDA
jgi:DNA-binding XRE family transcriptional regulator